MQNETNTPGTEAHIKKEFLKVNGIPFDELSEDTKYIVRQLIAMDKKYNRRFSFIKFVLGCILILLIIIALNVSYTTFNAITTIQNR